MKRLLYYTDVLPILSKKEIALNKIKRNLSIFASNADKIKVIWHPYIRTEEFMIINEFEFLNEYRQIVLDFKDKELGEFDESKDLKVLADTCDAYYGDYSDAVYYMQENKKPVMIESFDV